VKWVVNSIVIVGICDYQNCTHYSRIWTAFVKIYVHVM
jgi:hypothetical protein